MKNSVPARLFFMLGGILWMPIAIGIVAMVHIGQPLAVLAAIALGTSLGTLVISAFIRRL